MGSTTVLSSLNSGCEKAATSAKGGAYLESWLSIIPSTHIPHVEHTTSDTVFVNVWSWGGQSQVISVRCLDTVERRTGICVNS